MEIKEIDADVELLIGVNIPKAMESWQIINSEGNGPYAVRTLLGWVINGPINLVEDEEPSQTKVNVNRISVANTEELFLKQYNQEFPKTYYEEKRDDKKCIEIVSNQVVKIDSHYSLPPPFRSNNDVKMPNNREIPAR